LSSGIKFFAEALRASPINTTSVGSFRFLFILVPFLLGVWDWTVQSFCRR
jgi:hypothetical protein